MSLWFSLALAAGLGLTSPQEAPVPVAEPEVQVVDDIVVQAELRSRQLRDRMDVFIEDNMGPPPRRPLARWNKPVCIATANFSASYAQAVIDRVATRIIETGGDVAGPDCRVDVMIVGTTDGAATARELVRSNRSGFRPASGGTDLGAAALKAFQEGVKPVRWWHVSLPVNVDTGQIAITLDGEEPAVNTVRDASRLRTNTRDDLARVVIVVDFTQTGQVSMGALTDYIAFVALAQVDPEGSAQGQASILSLFKGGESLTGLTQWDQDYLAALYLAAPNRPRVDAQARDIATQVLRRREGRREE